MTVDDVRGAVRKLARAASASGVLAPEHADSLTFSPRNETLGRPWCLYYMTYPKGAFAGTMHPFPGMSSVNIGDTASQALKVINDLIERCSP